jgi:hypothetical protein
MIIVNIQNEWYQKAIRMYNFDMLYSNDFEFEFDDELELEEE